VCENNRYAEFTDSATMTRVPSVAARAEAYGIEASTLDGNDVEAVLEAALAAAARARRGDGPLLLELETYRWHGHYEGDAQPYKPSDEAESWRARDPLVLAERRLVERGEATEAELEHVRERADSRIDEAVQVARSADPPPVEEAYTHVFAD
jgi:pyruvate dehydrogenase E1 component alpha subunit